MTRYIDDPSTSRPELKMIFWNEKKLIFAAIASSLVLSACIAQPVRVVEVQVSAQERHPAYLHALSNLWAARWMIEHRPGDWARMADEVEAVHQIDAAIGEIKHAAIDDGKNINDHPAVDDYPDHSKRLHAAVAFLEKAHADIRKEEDNVFAEGLRDRALSHIDAAVRATRHAINE